MADRYTTDTDTMEATASGIEDAAANFTAEVNGLMGRLSNMGSDFVGGAGSSFQQVSTAVSDLTGVAYAALAETAEMVRTSGRRYAVTDDELRADMQSAGASESAIAHALLINPGS
jgi:uncharacterized protein YukE